MCASSFVPRGVARIRRRAGLARMPVLTLVVFVVTAGVNAAQLAVPSLLADLERNPAGLHGQWWRTFTSLFVQDGGVVGAMSNLLFLLALGTLAEQALPRSRWLLYYFGIGVVGEFAGYLWQPVGGGNSVAICGLSGALVVAIVRGTDGGGLPGGDRPIRGAVPVQLVWCGALLGTWQYPLVGLGVLAAVVSARFPASRRMFRAVLAATAATALVLSAVRNIHGAALLAALLLAASWAALSGARAHSGRATGPVGEPPR